MRDCVLSLTSIILIAVAGCGPTATGMQPPPAAALTGQPCWLPLGPEVYQERDVPAAAVGVLRVRPQPRWFSGFAVPGTREQFDAYMARTSPGSHYAVQVANDGYAIPSPPPFPRTTDEIPTSDQGCRLTLAISPESDPNTLAFRLRLSAGTVPLFREIEHRWSNALPFLFAFYVDRKAVSVGKGGFGKSGGVMSLVPLVAAGETREWNVRVDADSVRALLPPDGSPHSVSVVAAFSNSQHVGHTAGATLAMQQMVMRDGKVPVTLLVRSSPADLRWDPGARQWRSE